MSEQPKDLLSKETRDLMIQGVRMLGDDWRKLEILQKCPMPTHLEAVLYTFERIDWTNQDSIRPHLALIECLIHACPQTLLNVPRKLRDSLERDGFKMNLRGRLE